MTMKHRSLIASVLLLAAPALALAQGPAPQAQSANTAARHTARAKPSPSRVAIKSQAENIAAGIRAADAALTPEELALAEHVYVGRIACELGAVVTLTPDEKSPGYFILTLKNLRYHLSPVASRTGAIRLEDPVAGVVWLQIPNKSMLMNQKIGQRLADECMSPAQQAVADNLKQNPPPSMLDAAPTQAAVK